jgi:hypothetical protein
MKMKAAVTIAALGALGLGLQQVRAQEPFRPVPVAPPCNSSINRGAQEALDVYMMREKTEIAKKKNEQMEEYLQARARGEQTAGLKAANRITALFDDHTLQRKLSDKQIELKKFAYGKYGCELLLFYYLP